MAEDPEAEHREVAEVFAEETNRGKRGPASSAARRAQARLNRLFRKLLERGTEAEFRAAMRVLKPPLDPDVFLEALRVWRENRRP